MGISATGSRFNTVLLNRQKQRDAASFNSARSEARRQATAKTLSSSDIVRSTMVNRIAKTGLDQTQLTAQLIRTRMIAEAAKKAEPTKWSR